MIYDKKTIEDAVKILEKSRTKATTTKNKFNKIRGDEGKYPCRGVLGELGGGVSAGQMYLIWTEVEFELKEAVSSIRKDLTPVESRESMQKFSEREAHLDSFLKSEFPEWYNEAKKKKIDPIELTIFILGKVSESSRKK